MVLRARKYFFALTTPKTIVIGEMLVKRLGRLSCLGLVLLIRLVMPSFLLFLTVSNEFMLAFLLLSWGRWWTVIDHDYGLRLFAG